MENIYLSDMITGILSALVCKDTMTLYNRDNRIDKTLEGMMTRMEMETIGTRLRFRITTSKVYGDSAALQDGLKDAAGRGLLSIDSPGSLLRIRISPEQAALQLDRLPGNRAMYERIADEFLKRYKAP